MESRNSRRGNGIAKEPLAKVDGASRQIAISTALRLKSGGFIRAEVEQLFIINQTGTQMVEETNASDHVDRKVFRLGEVNNRLPLQTANRQRDFVTIGRERT